MSDQGTVTFPEALASAEAMIAAARLAADRGDWDTAIKAWADLRAARPDLPEGTLEGFEALRHIGHWEAAEVIAAEGVRAFPELPEVWHQHALAAFERGDAAAAAQRWLTMCDRFPHEALAHQYAMLALRVADQIEPAEAIAALAVSRFPGDAGVLIEYTLLAIHHADWQECVTRAARIRAVDPDAAEGYRFGILALRESGRTDEADALGAAGIQAAPEVPDLHHEHALTALHRGDAAEAAARWEAMRIAFPDAPDGYRYGIIALREAGRTDEAERLAEAAISRHGHVPAFWNEYALMAYQRGALDEASRRWAAMRHNFPAEGDGYAGGVMALRETASFEEVDRQIRIADEVARDGMRRFPDDRALWREYAMNALHGRDWAQAAQRWDHLRSLAPDDADAFRFGVIALRSGGQAGRAEQLAKEALERFPHEPDLWIEYASNADYANDPNEAARRWEQLRKRFPDRQEGYLNGVVALRAAGRFPEAEALLAASMSQFADDEAMRLLMRFESLGDTCEFGLVQRHFGAEPLGLLRWSSIAVPDLVRALNTRFDRLGDPDTVQLHLESGTYMIVDDHTGMQVHSFVDGHAMERDRFFATTCRWLRFLKEKLLRDLEHAEKIFVYKPRYGRISDDDVALIHQAVRRYGEAPFLCLRTADDAHPDGMVEQFASGLMIGYVARVSPSAYEPEILFQSWLQVCLAAARLVDGAS